MSYAIFKDGKQISKSYSYKLQAQIDAWKRGFVFSVSRYGEFLANDVEVKEVQGE